MNEISTDVKGGVGTITLNRPEKKNALSIRLREELTACLGQWKTNPDVTVVVLRGAGGTFSAGFDRTELLSTEPNVQKAVFQSSKVYHRAVWSFPKPTIAAIEGYALGGGFDLAVLCDLRVGADNAQFGHPEIKFGAPPLTTPLRWIVGDGWARDLCLSGRRIDAATAFRIGLITHLVPVAELSAKVDAVAQQLMEAPAETLSATKGFFVDGAGEGFEPSFVREHDRVFETAYGL